MCIPNVKNQDKNSNCNRLKLLEIPEEEDISTTVVGETPNQSDEEADGTLQQDFENLEWKIVKPKKTQRWCRTTICARARGNEPPRQRVDTERAIPSLHLDFFFLGEEEGGNKWPCVVMREKETRFTTAYAMSSKSITDDWAVKKMLLALQERINATIHCEHPIVSCMVMHSSKLLNWIEVGRDGRTSYHVQ